MHCHRIAETGRLRRKYGAFLIIISLVPFLLALFFAAAPSSWFISEQLAAVGDWARSVWPKLNNDVLVLDSRVPLRGAKYVIFQLSCLVFAIGAAASMAPINRRLLVQETQMTQGLRVSLIGSLLIGLFLFFDTWSVGSNARMARAITNTVFLWFWAALLWWVFSLVLGLAIVASIQFLTRKWPESR